MHDAVNGFLLRLLDLARKWWICVIVRMVLPDAAITVKEEDASAVVGMSLLDEMGSAKKMDLSDFATKPEEEVAALNE
ncbi:hypothetical protein ACLOJK_027137 [Asimina triloba]